MLIPDTAYDQEKELQFFHPPSTPGLSVHLQPGDFAVFLPHDAHMPKIQVGSSVPLRKAVVKIDLGLFG